MVSLQQALLKELEGKEVADVLEAGRSKLSAVPAGGASAAAPAAAGGDAPAAGGDKKKDEPEEEEDEDMGFGLFD